MLDGLASAAPMTLVMIFWMVFYKGVLSFLGFMMIVMLVVVLTLPQLIAAWWLSLKLASVLVTGSVIEARHAILKFTPGSEDGAPYRRPTVRAASGSELCAGPAAHGANVDRRPADQRPWAGREGVGQGRRAAWSAVGSAEAWAWERGGTSAWQWEDGSPWHCKHQESPINGSAMGRYVGGQQDAAGRLTNFPPVFDAAGEYEYDEECRWGDGDSVCVGQYESRIALSCRLSTACAT